LRAVLDVNVIISAVLSPGGAPAKILRAWLDGEFEFVASESLLSELDRALAYPKLRSRIEASSAQGLVEFIRREAKMTGDPDGQPTVHSPDPGDDYLISLGASAGAVIISGDGHLLGIAHEIPVYSPTHFLALLDEERRGV
jgi:putative PIN family toxin of toxin-antitoxin system